MLHLELGVITNYTMQLHLLKDKVWWSQMHDVGNLNGTQ